MKRVAAVQRHSGSSLTINTNNTFFVHAALCGDYKYIACRINRHGNILYIIVIGVSDDTAAAIRKAVLPHGVRHTDQPPLRRQARGKSASAHPKRIH